MILQKLSGDIAKRLRSNYEAITKGVQWLFPLFFLTPLWGLGGAGAGSF